MSQITDHDNKFIEFLEGLANKRDRGALAALRRGLGKKPGEAAEMYPYVVRWVPQDAQYLEDAYYLVTSLFAWHQGSWPKQEGRQNPSNLGASFALLRTKEKEAPGIERRFIALLNCHRDDLGDHLRHAVGLLKSKEIPIDWAQLLHDIKGWGWESRSIQREWARAFWGDTAIAVEAGVTTVEDNLEPE